MATPAGWACVQIADLIDRAQEQLTDASTALGAELVASVQQGADVSLSDAAVERISQAAQQALELTERLPSLAEDLPRDGATFGIADVRDGAAADLAQGIIEPERALLAAGMLDLRRGCSALSKALASADAHRQWGPVTVEEVLSRFEGSDRLTAHDIAARAAVAPATRLADAGPEEIARLADALAHVAAELPRG